MKRFLAFFLALVMLFAMVPVLGTTAKAESTTVAETVTEKPFYGLTWDTLALSQFGNLAYAPIITVEQTDGVVSLGGLSASAMKTKLDAFPEGMRYFRIFKTLNALKANAECVVYADDGVAQLKALMTAYIEEYYALGGKLDGIILDTEYTAMGSWYIYSDTYGGYYEPSAEKIEANGFNRNIYNDIVNHPNYATDIRPLLEERGFVFYDAVGGNKSEIWSMFPPQIWSSFSSAERTKFNTYYTNCYAIWNRVMSNRIAAYMTDAVYNPMAARYPNATVSDYTVTDSATWENYMSEGGGIGAMVGNADKAGNTSNENMYNAGPNSGFFVSDGVYQYNNIQSYNKAVYDDDAYNSFMFYVNRFKGVYAATDTKNISTWIAEYDYSGRDNSVKNSPYYTEYLYHVGLLDPKPFLVYMYLGSSKFTGTEGKTAYNERMQVISQALAELTKVAGYSDRKPIETPQSWNDGFILSGMYANGRNIWRLTPDTTDGTTLASFKKLGSAVAFSINGNTITFPQGTIIKDSTINTVGSCGYWIETPADVQPVITRVADRYAKYPSYQETFTYDDGTIFNSDNAKEVQAWEASADLLIESGALALTGTATLNNVKLPKNITAGDNYAKKQVWEVSITVPESMSSTSSNYVTLLSAGTNDGFKVQGNSVYYSKKGTTVVSYTKISDLTLTVGEKYTLRREMDFTANTCTYSVLDTSGNLLKQIADVAIEAFTLPVSTISMASNSMSTKVLVDDYKLYPTGVQQNIKFYDANTGVYQSATEQLTNSKVAYRFSWMNATNTATEAQVRVARYDSSGTLVSDTLLKTVEMQANWDGVDTGIVENTTGKVTVYLHTCDESNATLKDKVDGTCLTDGYTGDLVCNVCNEILTKGEVVPGTGHEEVVIAGKAATCTTDGLTEGKYCSACGETLVEQTVIPAGHTVVTVPGKAATCTEDGLTDGGECTACGEVLAVQTVIPATGHTEEILAGKAATCTEAGLTEGKTCTTCGEVLIAQTEISATGHKEAAPVQENVTTTSYERVVYCEYCGIELSRETVNVVTATVTLWGTEVTIDTDDSTADIPAAYYWTNGGEGAAPVAATADNWNYCFSIIDSIPTVTIRNADFTYAKSFLTATLDGKLKLAYEGTNNIIVPYSSSATYYFVKYAGATSAKGHLIVAGAENAVLNVTGGDNSASMLGVSNKAYLTISGGTFKRHTTKAVGV